MHSKSTDNTAWNSAEPITNLTLALFDLRLSSEIGVKLTSFYNNFIFVKPFNWLKF